jgi:hypothetical protein
VRLLALLDENLSTGATVQLTAHCTDATPEGAAAAVAADAAGCALVLMTAPGACKKLHREETIQVTQSSLTCDALSPAATSAAKIPFTTLLPRTHRRHLVVSPDTIEFSTVHSGRTLETAWLVASGACSGCEALHFINMVQ